MKKIIIIGGGFAGSFLAKKLEKHYNVTLIDTKNYFEFTPGILRTIINPEHLKNIQVLHKDYLKKSAVIKGSVKSISKNSVSVNSRKIPFDYLAICSGSKYISPIKEQNIIIASRASQLKKYYENLKNSKNILIVGGGLVGVELASEIICKYKDKKITLIHSKTRLMKRTPFKASRYAENFLKKRNVDIIYNERVIENNKNIFTTDKKTVISPDLVFWCTGIKTNFEFLLKDFRNCLNEKNHVKVNNYLQVNNCNNIFAAGDITDIKEEKTAQNAKNQAKIILNNINTLESKKPLREYKIKKTALVISLGKYHGILCYKNFVFTGFLPGILKAIIEKKEMLFLRFG